MKISGFSMGRNLSRLYYPVKQSIQSILPIVDEFVFALGDSEPGDTTRAEIESIGSDKIRIIDSVWDMERYPRGTVHAQQSNLARSACSGDWLFYLQADEVVHEDDLPRIQQRCRELLDDERVEGLLMRYYHFWGDYEHYQQSHGWYKNEIRIIRNHPEIYSWESAQSFRRIPDFDGRNYRQQEGTYKLKVALADAAIYHYGWVRPPGYMKTKIRHLDTNHKGRDEAERLARQTAAQFDYGPLNRLARFSGSHPAVMREWIARCDWRDQLQYSGRPKSNRPKHKHEKLKYRLVSALEKMLGREIGAYHNYVLLEDRSS